MTMRSLALRSIARTHVGLIRTLNEDRVFERPDRSLWAVVDGMGGHHGGDIAADLAIDTLRTLAAAVAPIDGEAVAAALRSANEAIYGEGRRRGATIGATIVALCTMGSAAEVIWAGDSRAYRLRGSCADQLTSDHSLVQELVDAGAITPDQAATHPRANVVTRALGVREEVALEHRRVELVAGDRILLCSDGLSRSLDLHDADGALADDEAWADRLLANALSRDGRDNISFVIVSAAPEGAVAHAA